MLEKPGKRACRPPAPVAARAAHATQHGGREEGVGRRGAQASDGRDTTPSIPRRPGAGSCAADPCADDSGPRVTVRATPPGAVCFADSPTGAVTPIGRRQTTGHDESPDHAL